ncbi:MAG: AAA family ATPase [Chitinivibrionales bacterium]|nr:AAA family ATPase [Chitinivibrionales bacterium]
MAHESKDTCWFTTVCIEGVIGIGKTSLCELLAQRFDGRVILEEVAENPFLPGFYANRKAYAFQTQMWFLLSRYRQLSEGLIQQDLFHSVTVSDYLFAKDRIFASINLDENEMSLYTAIADILEQQIIRPDLVVYLQASTNVLLQRIKKRGRPYEANMDAAYLEQLNQAYNQFFFHYTDSPVLIVDTNDIDFVGNEDDLVSIIEQIMATRSGMNFFRPLSTEERLKIRGMQDADT